MLKLFISTDLTHTGQYIHFHLFYVLITIIHYNSFKFQREFSEIVMKEFKEKIFICFMDS
jgi:hypothetical protein